MTMKIMHNRQLTRIFISTIVVRLIGSGRQHGINDISSKLILFFKETLSRDSSVIAMHRRRTRIMCLIFDKRLEKRARKFT
jgi:hypothetical protein